MVLGCLFEQVTKEKQQHIKSLDAKLVSQDVVIETLRKQLAEKQSIGTTHEGDALIPPSKQQQKAPVATSKMRPPLHAPKNGLEGLLRETGVKVGFAKGSIVTKTKEEEESFYEDEMDESFYPSDNENDDEDSDYESLGSKLKRKQAASKSRRQPKRSKSGESQDSFGSTGGRVSDSANGVENTDPLPMILIEKELTKYTVKELKELLLCRGLKVSGVKEDLIHRLQSFEDTLNQVVSVSMEETAERSESVDIISDPFRAITQQSSGNENEAPSNSLKGATSLLKRLVSESARETLKSITVNSISWPSTDPNFFKRKLLDPTSDSLLGPAVDQDSSLLATAPAVPIGFFANQPPAVPFGRHG